MFINFIAFIEAFIFSIRVQRYTQSVDEKPRYFASKAERVKVTCKQ